MLIMVNFMLEPPQIFYTSGCNQCPSCCRRSHRFPRTAAVVRREHVGTVVRTGHRAGVVDTHGPGRVAQPAHSTGKLKHPHADGQRYVTLYNDRIHTMGTARRETQSQRLTFTKKKKKKCLYIRLRFSIMEYRVILDSIFFSSECK